ncbi:MAG: hypothetical protein OJJ54_23220 [Pseudonocardia sp.]|nr:hypothetical protein [Pseudonocardia sp.]
MHSHETTPRADPPVRLPRRRSDRFDDAVAWLLVSLALLAVLGGVVVGMVVHGDLAEQARLQTATGRPADVVLAEDVPLVVGESTTVKVPAKVRWTAVDGTESTGVTEVTGPRTAGGTVKAWLTDDNRIGRTPLTPREVLFTAVVAALMAATAGSAVVAVLAQLAGRWSAAVHAAEWDREWRLVEPRWTARQGGGDGA